MKEGAHKPTFTHINAKITTTRHTNVHYGQW